jgi:prevent-host-death family protein
MRRPQRCEPPSEYRPRGRRPCGLCFDPIYRDADFWFDDWSRTLQIRPIDVTGQLRIFVREIQASEAKAHLASLLDAVDRGETIVITRHGKPIARIVPEVDLRQAEFDRVIAEIEEFRRTMPRVPLEELLSARHEGHKY